MEFIPPRLGFCWHMYKKEMKVYMDIWKNFKYHLSDMHIYMKGNSAWVIHDQTMELPWCGTTYSSKGWNIRVLEKINNKWKIAFHITGGFSPENFSAIQSKINSLGYRLLELIKIKKQLNY